MRLSLQEALDASKSRRVELLAKVIARDGCSCVRCGKIGTHFRLNVDKGGAKHYDFHAEDGTMMTLDHIVPKSKGGRLHLGNAQLMCKPCNESKSNSMEDWKKSINKFIDGFSNKRTAV